MLSLSGPPGPWLLLAALIARSAAQPVNPVCLSGGRTDAAHRPCRWHFRGTQPGLPGHAIQRPNASLWAYSGPVFCAPNCPFSGTKGPSPAAFAGGGVVVSEPIWDDRRGPKTHSRRTGIKLGQVRYARQGLVRVPESNTKYGGKRGITGADAAPVMGASIGESSGIRQGKKCSGAVEFHLLPAVHRASIYSRSRRRLGLHFEDSRRPTEACGPACRRRDGRGGREGRTRR